MKELVIIGAGGHGKVIADIAEKIGCYSKISFLDDGEIDNCLGFPVVGKVNDLEKYAKTSDVFVAIGNIAVRKSLIERLIKLGANIPTLIHPSAIIGSNVNIGVGTSIMAGVVVNPCAKIGVGVIVNTSSVVDHDCNIGDFCHISVGARIAGTVTVDENVFICAGVTVKNNIKICANCVIGAGAVVVKDIVDRGTYVGVPAKMISR